MSGKPRWWLATAADQLRTAPLKRFDSRYWTVDFPRPMMASVTAPAAGELVVDLEFQKRDDLAGLIWDSVDRWDHPLNGYATDRDYSGVTLEFRWRSGAGIAPLSAADGAVLTVEGRDGTGVARTWYVRLWNYAQGTGDDAVVRLDFSALDAGFTLPAEAQRVDPRAIDRLFIGIAPAVRDGTSAPLAEPIIASLTLSEIRSYGSRSTLEVGDAQLPPHSTRIATGFDDSYQLTPERLLMGMVRMGYTGMLVHYVGMSHFPALRWDGAAAAFLPHPTRVLCAPAIAWHRDFVARAVELGFEPVMSISYELLDQNAPAAWKQRAHDNRPALTGWSPPSTLLSPCVPAAMAWLRAAVSAFVALAVAAGARARFQVGEPWWWVSADGAIHGYDAATTTAWRAERGIGAPLITDARVPLSSTRRAYLDWLGTQLSASTLALRDAARVAAGGACECMLLFYAPQVLDTNASEIRRANMPVGWASPAWDVLQLEDYDFVTGDDPAGRRRGADAVTANLGYPPARQHYFSGFVLDPSGRSSWSSIADAADEARWRDVAETLVWAWPQVARDGFVIFEVEGETMVPAFHDVSFPLPLGYGATGGPRFATQVAVMASGFESRNSGWAEPLLGFDAGVGIRSDTDMAVLIGFFRARRGQAHAFRFRDPLDHSSGVPGAEPRADDQRLGVGDGGRTDFALIKSYGELAHAQARTITRPVNGSVKVAVDGVERLTGWVLEPLGIVRFASPIAAGAVVTAGFLFDVPVRFAEDRIDVSIAGWRAGETPSVPLTEVRER